MSRAETPQTNRDRLEDVLGQHAGDLDDAVATEDDPAVADACAILAAVARGETPPEAAARRALRRAKEADR